MGVTAHPVEFESGIEGKRLSSGTWTSLVICDRGRLCCRGRLRSINVVWPLLINCKEATDARGICRSTGTYPICPLMRCAKRSTDPTLASAYGSSSWTSTRSEHSMRKRLNQTTVWLERNRK